MPLKPLEDIIQAYPWPPLSNPESYRYLLRFLLADFYIKDPRLIAYILATVRHETGFAFAPVSEYALGSGRPYGVPDPETGQAYYGRGYVQITWKENYARFCPVTGLDLVSCPDMALEPGVAYRIASIGMRQGMFTGKKLLDFVQGDSFDWTGARQIINGNDQADRIADYAKKLYASIVTS